MRPIKEQYVPIERITHEGKQNFFGYYDIQPFSGDNAYHLCHRVDFKDRMQSQNDVAEIGMIRLYDNTFIPLARTYAWNFQQGSLLQWHPAYPNDKIIYNAIYGDENYCERFSAVIRDIKTGEKKILPMPLANVSPDGKFGLSINFARVYWLRPGYGYAGIKDSWENEAHPTDDGVWRVDLETGETKLVISTDTLFKICEPYMTEDERSMKYVVNHVNLNTDGTRFLMLFRGRFNSSPNTFHVTYTITCNSDGSDPYVLLCNSGSHLHWRDNENVLIWSEPKGSDKTDFYLLKDKTHEYTLFDPDGLIGRNGHVSFSPDRRYVLNDTYPLEDGFIKLSIYDTVTCKRIPLADICSEKLDHIPCEDVRCDLHPRWSRDGSMISFDSVHEGHRHIYRIRTEDIKELQNK